MVHEIGLSKKDALRRTVFRPFPNTVPDIALPFYPRSVGCFKLVPGERELIPDGKKNFVQFFWCVAGAGTVRFETGTETVVRGDCFYHLPGERHCHICGPEGWGYRWMAFDGENAEKFLLSYGYPRGKFRGGACPEQRFDELEELLREMTPRSWREMISVICGILAAAGGSAGDGSSGKGRLFQRILALCRTHFTDAEWDVNRLADELEIDRSTVRRIFQERMGESPSEYLMRLRIQEALSLLSEKEILVAEAARRSGFSSPNYFSRVIRRATGMNPAAFRTGASSAKTSPIS